MQRTYHRTIDGNEVTESDAFDARGVLRPGFTMRTAVMLRDGVPPLTDADEKRFAAMDARDAALSDAWRNPGLQFRDSATEVQQHEAANAAVNDAYERRDRRLENAWR